MDACGGTSEEDAEDVAGSEVAEDAVTPAPGGRARAPLGDMSSTLNRETDPSALDTTGKSQPIAAAELVDAGSDELRRQEIVTETEALRLARSVSGAVVAAFQLAFDDQVIKDDKAGKITRALKFPSKCDDKDVWGQAKVYTEIIKMAQIITAGRVDVVPAFAPMAT